MIDFTKEIQNDSPKAWKYFLEFYQNETDYQLKDIDFETLAFEFQLGVFLDFFASMSIDIQLYAIEKDALQEAVKESFATYEEYLFLDS